MGVISLFLIVANARFIASTLSYYNKQTIVFTVDPSYGNLNKNVLTLGVGNYCRIYIIINPRP